jgi:ClpP class serine protease
MEAEHYVILQGIVNEFYNNFRGLVIERRGAESLAAVHAPSAAAIPTKPIEMSRIEDLTDGRVMTGASAVEFGLADGIGGITDAFGLAKVLAGVKAAELVKYYRQDSDAPRTPYAASGVPAPSGDINLFQLRVDGLHSPIGGAGAYYLWVAGE